MLTEGFGVSAAIAGQARGTATVGNDHLGGVRPTTGHGTPGDFVVEEPRAESLLTAVTHLQRELAAYPNQLLDRTVAEDELVAMAREHSAQVPRMRNSLLLIVGALGSVSALRPALTQLHQAINLYGVQALHP